MEMLNRENFRMTVKEGKKLVMFKSPTCAPCKTVEGFLDNAVQTDVPYFGVDATKEPVLAAQYEIMKSPTLLLFEEGEVVKRHTGLITPPQIEEFLK